MIQTILDQVSQRPQAWNVLRRIVEANFYGEREVIANELAPWRDGQRRFLDFGCGTGEFARDFPAGQYVGVDPAVGYIRFAGRARPGAFAAMDGTRLAFQACCFDAALVLGVFHHLPDARVRAAVQNLHYVLKPGATLLVMEDVPPPDAWNVAGHAMHWLDRGGHIRSDAEYRALLAPQFALRRSYHMRSGICDYAVYVLERHEGE